MGKIVKKICLTGGPCAGKSSSLDLIKEYLDGKSYIVYIVNESATELINSGIKPFGENKVDIYEFQEIVLKYQLFKERLVENVARSNDSDKDIVIIYDRGIIDNKAYINQELFNKLLYKYNLSEFEVLNRYDVVIHLETAAKGVGYTKENNKARSEDNERAIIMDDRVYDAWKYHNNLIKVKSYENFDDKQKEIIKICENVLNEDVVKN